MVTVRPIDLMSRVYKTHQLVFLVTFVKYVLLRTEFFFPISLSNKEPKHVFKRQIPSDNLGPENTPTVKALFNKYMTKTSKFYDITESSFPFTLLYTLWKFKQYGIRLS